MSDYSEKFAGVLWAAIKKQGLTYRQTAMRAREHLPPGSKLSDVSVWSYAQGRSIPRSRENVDALEKALGVAAGDLLALHGAVSEPRQTANEAHAEHCGESRSNKPFVLDLQVFEVSSGMAFLRVSQIVSWPLALRILEQLQCEAPPLEATRRSLDREDAPSART